MIHPFTVILIAVLSCALTSCFGVKQKEKSRGIPSTTYQGYQSNPTQTKTRRALLIANSDYQKSGNLNGTPLRDVKVMAHELRTLGYQVDIKENMTNVGLRDVIGDFSETLSERDEVFFHYAGHGIEIDGEALLLGVDFSARDKRDANLQGFSVSSIVSQMSHSSKAVVVIDACRDNPFTRSIFRSGRANQGMLSSSSTIEAEIGQGGVYVVFSTLKGERALNGGELSPFVQAFQGVVRDHANESVTEVFSNHMQRRLLKEGQELVTRTFGVWSFYALKRPDASCPSECQPGCQVACISKFNAQAQEIKRLREFVAQAQARASTSATSSTPVTSQVDQAPPEPVKSTAQPAHQFAETEHSQLSPAERILRRADDDYRGKHQNLKDAALNYKRACELQSIRGCLTWAYFLHDGRGVNPNKAEANKVVTSALLKQSHSSCEQGDLAICTRLGTIYDDGIGVQRDPSRGVSLHRKAAEGGNITGQSNLGFMYMKGQGVKQNYNEAMHWYRKAAEQGNSNAQNNLGFMYMKGQGVKQDYNEAMHWYRKAAEQGNSTAQTNLGFMYRDGQGVKQDYNEAVRWYQKAAEQGDSNAQTNLGFMYENGQGVKKAKNNAIRWYRKAAEQGDSYAQKRLKILDPQVK